MSPGPVDSRTDQELVADLNSGDVSAFESMYRRHRDWAWRVARRFARDDTEAADAVQDAFMRLLAKFPGFRLTGKLTTYLYPVVRNAAVTMARKSRGLKFTDQVPESTPGGARQSDVGSEGGERTELDAALANLPEIQREVLLMRAVDQMSMSEIALALGIPEGTVKSRLHHALATLRETPGLAEWFMDA